MRIPHTIPEHTFDVFRCSEETKRLLNEVKRKLRPEDEEWYDQALPPDLKTQALRVIAAGWHKNPVPWELMPTLEDRDLLLELLPPDLPFEFAITHIPYEHYWKRASEAKWKYNDVTEHGNCWRQLYCERYVAEYVEHLEPAYFRAEYEKTSALAALTVDFVESLRLVHLLPFRSDMVPKVITEDDVEDEPKRKPLKTAPVHHIPLGEIFNMFPNLTKIYMNFGMVYRTDPISPDAFELSVEDCLSVGQGAKGLRHLRKLSITRSKLDQPKVAALLQGLAVNTHLHELDLSHCELGDNGALAVGAYLALSRIRCVNLANNKIGPEGLSGIVHGMLRSEYEPCLQRLNLRLNPLGDQGGDHLSSLLLRNETLEYLNVSACGIGGAGGMSLAEVLTSGSTKFQSLVFDISNNDMGPIVGEAFEVVAKSCVAVVELDMRLCGFNKESEYSIYQNVIRNKSIQRARSPLQEQRTARKSCASLMEVKTLMPPTEFRQYQSPFADVSLSVMRPPPSYTDMGYSEEGEEGEDEEDATTVSGT